MGGTVNDKVRIQKSSFPTPMIPPILETKVFAPIWKELTDSSTCSSNVTTNPDLSIREVVPIWSTRYLQNNIEYSGSTILPEYKPGLLTRNQAVPNLTVAVENCIEQESHPVRDVLWEMKPCRTPEIPGVSSRAEYSSANSGSVG